MMREDLAPLTVIPRGFGGSTMHDLLHYVNRIVVPYRPRAIVVYEGDNDMSDDKPVSRRGDEPLEGLQLSKGQKDSPGVCIPWGCVRKDLPDQLGGEDLLQRIWEDIDGLGDMFIWQCLLFLSGYWGQRNLLLWGWQWPLLLTQIT